MKEPGWEIMKEGQIKEQQFQTKVLGKVKHTRTYGNEKIPKRQPQTSLSIKLEEINLNLLAKEGRLRSYRDWVKQWKQNK